MDKPIQPELEDREACLRRVMGVPFWNRPCGELLKRMQRTGGLLVVPSAPSFCTALEDPDLWRAHVEADYAVMDSGYLSLLLSAAAKKRPPRISGHQVIEKLFAGHHVPTIGKDRILWVVPGEEPEGYIRTYLESIQLDLGRMEFYRAPQYDDSFEDPVLVERIREFDPAWVIICISGGRQEKLGLRLRARLEKCPSILCTGAAIFFFSGGQAHIPRWVDRVYLGWFWRILSDPKRFGPRYWDALRLPLVLASYLKNRR